MLPLFFSLASSLNALFLMSILVHVSEAHSHFCVPIPLYEYISIY